VSIPVMVLAHSRPQFTRQVLAAASAAKPSAILFVVDGARDGHGEDEAVAAVRDLFHEFEWDCPADTLFFQENVGVRAAMTQGLDLFFASHAAGAILEDDCLPAPGFFKFVEAALDKYVAEPNVGMISGTNMLVRSSKSASEAFFSEGHIWGWATWRDRWQNHRAEDLKLSDVRNAPRYYGIGWPYRRRLIERSERDELNSWAIPWLYHLAEHMQYCLIPPHNLVRNVGHSEQGTHTSGASRYSNLVVGGGATDIGLPDKVVPNREYQRRYAIGLQLESFIHRARRPLVHFARRLLQLVRTRS